MLLAVDIGNSNIALGVFRGAELRLRCKLSALMERSADEYAAIIYDLLRMNDLPREEIGGVIVASVVPELTERVEIIGNAALAGAAQILLDREKIQQVRQIAASSRHWNLGGNPRFNEYYMNAMLFPFEE